MSDRRPLALVSESSPRFRNFAVALRAALAIGAAFVAPASAQTTDASVDPFLWLESAASPRALDWVKAENAKTLAVLQNDPRFASAYADAVAAGEAQDRIPAPSFVAGRVYNFWQDARHVRGIWRSASVAEYAQPQPQWGDAILDLDAVAKAEGENWVWQGADCESPSERRCLIDLSAGGEDAKTVREFDLGTKRFVSDGFVLPHGKQMTAWVDNDTLLLAREWSSGDLTTSGYPFVVKRLERGKSIAAAVEVFRGSPSDVGVNPFEIQNGEGRRLAFINRDISFFEHETYLVTPGGTRKLDIPRKASPVGMIGTSLLVKTEEAWRVNGRAFAAGSLVAVDVDRMLADPAHLAPAIVYAPGDRETLDNVVTLRDRLLVTTLENVKGRAYVMTPAADQAWTKKRLDLPDDSTITPATADAHGSSAYLFATGFLTPTALFFVDVDRETVATVKALAPKFDASRDVVEQFEAVSSDGTRVPYFVVRPKTMPFDGTTPTIMYAYGGFAVSETPTYSATLGKLWLERGGAYVLANIRGGGEFGPAWHEAGLTTHRQRIYDDFAAVARDLTARKITSPQHLGIRGGSNGGLLMGVEFTQHPELWRAVDIEVPLLDMLRFEKIAAGASWVGEYGSVSNPEQRAFLAKISPYAQLKKGVAYPEPFVWTTTKDDRVGPQHARKFAAKLAALGDPYLFYEVTEGGHGAGANIKEQSFTTALEYTYFARKLIPVKAASR